jgi:hypothetical protein
VKAAKGKTEDKQIPKLPFDIEHRNTVFWRTPDDRQAAEQLKAMIRKTLPTEAILEDPERPAT